MPLSRRLLILLLIALALPCSAVSAPAGAPVAHAPPFVVSDAQLTPEYWIKRSRNAQTPRMTPVQIADFNAQLLRDDASMHDIAQLPDMLAASEVRARIEAVSATPTRPLYEADGKRVDGTRLAALRKTLALDALPAQVTLRFALVVSRAALRTFPTAQRVFTSTDDRDIDRFQESALYPGTPVAILHSSADGAWKFVIAANYAAWIASAQLAESSRAEVLDYARRGPRLVVTAARTQTAYTPESPAISALTLDMGSNLPLLGDWPPQQPVNGQLPLAAYVLQLALRSADGRLQLVPALIPRAADVHIGALPVTDAAVLRQAFKFLGERYGWGNDYDARDCSGFVLDVYRSLGIALPRNTGDQARSTVLRSVPFDTAAPLPKRLRQLAQLQVGDLIYIPGHVMLVIGHAGGAPWVIHDVAGASYRAADGSVQRARLNGVSVTPLLPLLASDGTAFIDHITRIQRVAPTDTP
ncbi:SH3 domain-containing protein [Xanthomonas prunicola]|uniref:SH3 domain-containing protein n=1 Tax=Xanthomonas prunicola TaxID=2053930 RepID=A0A9Q9IZX6_9XANT|nr:SH3 domain-containing protein [Xanthomonas prunicola]USI98966.1 SH3 domain-containing protein [Xanthomonas prunicola]UXA47382.1 SH3 domain-containing protein [Xanthomonas prunicola]UXA55842.1 SH3 domain-containing protein [Xanthomonas prunicola]UXA61800.1 SH3 domain-containing protein [Xanthomonas prunicola]UXA64015.1 SH3 domain-containing protein [Xanthomonas prunicola]